MGLPDRNGLVRVQPGQTDAVDQFVGREETGYKAEGFSRQRVFISMNRNEESSLPGITSMPSISRHGGVIQDCGNNQPKRL